MDFINKHITTEQGKT